MEGYRYSAFERRVNYLPWIIAGVVCALISIVPFIVLRENSIVTYHDQLDGELITYILNASHLFDGENNYPEIMNGIYKNGMVSPAPLFVLLFKLFNPFSAYVVCTLIVRIVSVLSMFLLLSELTDNRIISFGLALLFMLLPFYTVYGLCITGQPLIYYTYLRFRKEEFEWPWYFAIAFYVACSSFSLGGYAIVCVCGVVLFMTLIKNIHPLRYLGVFIIVLCGYIIENLPLVTQAFGLSDGFVSHKSEVVHFATGFFASVKNSILYGASYTEAYQLYYLPVVLLAFVLGMCFKYNTAGEKEEFDRAYSGLLQVLLAIVFIVLVVAVTESKPFLSFVNSKSGVIHDFNFSRFSWLLTVLWFVALALSIKVLWLMTEGAALRILCRIVVATVVIVSVSVTAFFGIKDSDLKSNIMKIAKHGDYYMVTWNQFFASDLFEQVGEMIGRDKSEYRVVSLGIYPAAASYSGFYCLDAYSNNYDVNYKHAFREVITPQLEKSPYLADWFDKWGNRCYIVTNEYQNYFNVEKKWGNYISDCELNYDKLREMGCEYLISAIYIIEPGQYGLTLLNENEQAIETEDSWYRLFVYALN